MKKNIWKPGDIITTEKWNNIMNSYLGAYRLPVVVNENDSNDVTINMSYNQISSLLKQGVICYFILPSEQEENGIFYVTEFNDNENMIGNGDSYFLPSENNSSIMVLDRIAT